MSGPWSIVETSAFDPVARVDPHGRLKEQREQCPVLRDEPVKTWLLTRYAEVRETVNDRSLWRHWTHAEEGALYYLKLIYWMDDCCGMQRLGLHNDPNVWRGDIIF